MLSRCFLSLGLAAILCAPAVAQKPSPAGAPATPPAVGGKPDAAAPGAGAPGAPAPMAPSATAPSGDVDGLAAARALIEATGMTAIMDQMLAGMRPNLVQALRQQAPGVSPADVERAVDEVLMPEFRARLPELSASIAEIYTRNFTAAELRELLAFYATPVGRKALQVMPQLLQESMALGQNWGQRVATEALTKHRAALRSRGFSL